MENKINIARFKEGSRTAEVKDIWQWDYGQILRIQGLNLPTAVEIHFSLDEHGGEAVRRIGVTKDGVTDVVVPDTMLENESTYGDSYYFFAYIYLTDETSGNTEYKIRARVSTRSKPEGYVSGGNDTFAEILKTVNEIAEDKVDIPVPAKVGQVLAVKSVDEEGKPTEFEAHPIEETDPTVPEWAKQPEKPTYTASEVGADAAGTAESKVSAHNVSDTAHNDIRLLVQGLAERLNTLADSDDETLDQMSEVVAYIKSNKNLIDAITTSKINVSDIIDNLTANVSNKPLSAAQGVKLKALIDAIAVVELDESLTDNTKAAPAGMVGELKRDLTGLQTVVDSKADASDLVKTNLYLDALFKLNRGQTYDVLEQESKAYSVDVPSGSKYASIDKVGGKSVVWNQLCNAINAVSNTYYINNNDGTITVKSGANEFFKVNSNVKTRFVSGHKYLALLRGVTSTNELYLRVDDMSGQLWIATWKGSLFTANDTYKTLIYIRALQYSGEDVTVIPQIFDLTAMFGAGNEPSTVEEFEAMFHADYYPYSEPTIISSQTDRIDVASADGTITQQITTNFPALNSAGSVYDYIDLNEGKLHQRVGVVDLGTFNWDIFTYGVSTAFRSYNYTGKKPSGSTDVANIICSDYESASADDIYSLNKDKAIAVHNGSLGLLINDSAYTDKTAFKEAMNGVILYYELAEEIITDIEIPTELTDWMTVETGGSITFHNSDEGKLFAIPNKETFIRKLDEVTV